MPPPRERDADLLRRARQGDLRRSNTLPGTPERSAVDRATYERRGARHPELTVRQALGHQASGDVAPTLSLFTGDPPGPRLIVIEGASRRDARRAGLYMHATRQLLDDLRYGPQDAETIRRTFNRRFARWRPVAGFTLLADADAVIALVDELRAGEEEVVFDSGRSRPGRRRRR
jgi:hypothetical protein